MAISYRKQIIAWIKKCIKTVSPKVAEAAFDEVLL